MTGGIAANFVVFAASGLDPQVTEEFESIAQSSRQALNEMRGLLGILRGSEDAPLAPQPTLADIAVRVAR